LDYDAKQGLTKTDLYERININGSQINQWATMLNLDPDEYLFELTGWKKPLNARRYFPVLENEQKLAAPIWVNFDGRGIKPDKNKIDFQLSSLVEFKQDWEMV